MQKDKFDIEYPDEGIIKEQIKTIVMTGMTPKESFYSHLKEMYKQLGFKYLFRDKSEIIFAMLLTTLILISIGLSAKDYFEMDVGNVYTFIFISSPILYVVICLLSYLKLKQTNSYEVEMTCKYNVYQVAAFRMLVFSIVCLGINAGFISLMSASYQHVNFLQAFMISVSSLFLFSTISLYLAARIRSKLANYFFAVGWILMNLLISVYSNAAYQLWIQHIPLYVYIILILVCMIVYLKNLKRLIAFKKVEGVA